MIEHPAGVLSVLLAVLAGLFAFAGHPWGQRFFRIVPLLVFAYFVPTVLSNLGVIPLRSPLYEFIQQWMLPAALILLTMSVDIPAILRLGPSVLILFLAATATVVLGGPLAYLVLGGLVPAELHDQAWKGLAALSGSWIGGGANFLAVGKSVGADDSTLGMIVVVDVALANLWMAALLFFAGREKEMDERIGADRSSLETLRAKIEKFQKEVAVYPNPTDYFAIALLAVAGTTLAAALAPGLPTLGDVLGPFAWTVILATAFAIGVSCTPLRRLEGAGASKIGSVLLYLLVASIGAKAEFARVFDVPALFLIAAVWLVIHAGTLLLLRRWLRAPVFYMAVGSQANIGGAASAPIVAGAFHPALAPVGVILAIAGYVLGTYGGLLCAVLLRFVAELY